MFKQWRLKGLSIWNHHKCILYLLITTIVVFNPVFLPIKSMLLRMKWLFKYQYLLFFISNQTNPIILQPLEVVDRGGETELAK